MSQKEGKSRKPLVFVLIAAVVVLAVVLALVLTMCSGPEDPNPTQTTGSNAGMDYVLFWNVDRALYTGSDQGTGMTTREPNEDTGYYQILFATGGRQVQRRVAERRVVNKIDSMDLMGLVFDEKGIVIDVLDIEEITGGYAVNRFYVESVDGLNVVVNSSNTLKGMQVELELTENTKIYDMSGESEFIGALSETLYEMDCVIAIKNAAGEITDVFVVQREPQGPSQKKYCEHCEQEVTWRAWVYENDLPLKSGHFYLAQDVTVTDQRSMPENCEVILDLNGKTVTGAQGRRIYSLHNKGCYLAMMDYSEEQTGKFVPVGDISSQGAAVWLRYGQFDFYSGTLDGSQAVNHLNGGVVALEADTVFNMYGGTITGGVDETLVRADNSAIGGWGGNVYNYNGTFNMYGGVIKDGYAKMAYRESTDSYVGGFGGNVGVNGEKGVFNMYGGEILDGRADTGGGNIWKGGGATITIHDGLISGGSLTRAAVNGGNVFIGGTGDFILNGGKIVNGQTYNVGANVYLGGSGTLTINGGLIDGGEIIDINTGKVERGLSENIFCVNSHLVMTGGTVTGDIEILDYQGGKSSVTLSGNPVVKGSKDGSNNLKLPSNHQIILGELTKGADIHVTASGIFTTETVKANAKYFTADADEDITIGYYKKCLVIGEVMTHCICGHAHTEEDPGIGACDGTQHEWIPTTGLGGALSEGYWYLVSDIGTSEGNTYNVQHSADNGQKVYIDLNGHTIQNNANGKNRMFRIMNNDEGLLVITDTSKAQTGKLVTKSQNGDQGLLLWADKGLMQIYNITLDASESTSVMWGGAIDVSGGDVQMWNTTVIGGTVSAGAYSIPVTNEDGTKYTQYQARGGYGGAISVNSGTLEMTDSKIIGGTAIGAYITGLGKEGENTGTAGVSAAGGALYINGTANLVNCEISGGVTKAESYFTGFKYPDGTEYKSAWGYGGNVYITKNGTLNITDSVITGGVSGGTVNGQNDIKVDANGVILPDCEPVLGNFGRGGNIWTVGTLNATNTVITEGSSSEQGGNICIEGGTTNLILCEVSKGNSYDSGDNLDIRNNATVNVQGGKIIEAVYTEGGPDDANFLISVGTATFSSHTAEDGTVTPLIIDGDLELHSNAASGTVVLDGWVEIAEIALPTNRILTIGENLDEEHSSIGLLIRDLSKQTSYFGVNAKEGDENAFTTNLSDEVSVVRDDEGNLWLGKYNCICGHAHTEEDPGIGECDGTKHVWLPVTGIWGQLKEGYWYLINDIGTAEGSDYNNQHAVDQGQQVYLDLNGHTIQNNDNGRNRMFRVLSNAEGLLVITDTSAAQTGKLVTKSKDGDQGLLLWAASGNMRVYNITLDASEATSLMQGAAIEVSAGGTLKMWNTTVCGGTTTANAYPVIGTNEDGSKYTYYDARGGCGGAIAVLGNGTLEMTDSKIIGGTAVGAYVTGLGKEGENTGTAGIGANGGALYINGKATLTNCEVSGGEVKTESYFKGFKFADGTEYKTAWAYGGNIYVGSNGELNITDSVVSGGIAGGTVNANDDITSNGLLDENGVLKEGAEPVLYNAGGGGNISSAGKLVATNTIFTEGRSSEQGGNVRIEGGNATLTQCEITKGNSYDSGDNLDVRNGASLMVQGGNIAEGDHTETDPGHDVFVINGGTTTFSSYTAEDGTVTPLVIDGMVYLHGNAKTAKVVLDGQITITKLYVPSVRVLTIGENLDEENSAICFTNGAVENRLTHIGENAKEGDENAFVLPAGMDASIVRDEEGKLWIGKLNCICGHAHTEEDPGVGECDGTQHVWLPAASLDEVNADGYYYLTGDAVVSSQQWGGPRNINLSLNGHNITFTGESHRLMQPNGGVTWNLTNWDIEEGGQLINTVGYAKKTDGLEIGAVMFVNGANVSFYNIDLIATTYNEDGSVKETAQVMGTGAALYVGKTSTVNMYGCNVIGCAEASNSGGAIHVEKGDTQSGKLTMVGCTVSGGVAGNQGGNIYNGGNLTMTDCTVSGGVSTGFGGNIFNNGTLTMTDCTVTGGSSTAKETHGGGGNIYSSGNLTMTGCTVTDGACGWNGGNLRLSGTATLTDCTITGGDADNVSGNLHGEGDVTLLLDGCDISGGKVNGNANSNTANVFLVSGNVTIKDTTIDGRVELHVPSVTLDGIVKIHSEDGYGLFLNVHYKWNNHAMTLAETFNAEESDILLVSNLVGVKSHIAEGAKSTEGFSVQSGVDADLFVIDGKLYAGKYNCECGQDPCICGQAPTVWYPISNLTVDEGHWYLINDIGTAEGSTFNAQHAVDGGQKVYLDLNGHTVKNNSNNKNRMFRIMSNADGLLVITDNSEAQTGKLVTESQNGDQGLLLWAATGNMRIYNITLDASKATSSPSDDVRYNGAAVCVDTNATVKMHGVTILGGTVGDRGGAIYAGGTVELTDCTVSGGSAGKGGDTIYITGPKTTTITNSTITGEVWVAGGALTLKDTTVTGEVNYQGGGLTLDGKITIMNSNKNLPGLTIRNGLEIKLADGLAADSNIHLNASGYFANNAQAEDANAFTSMAGSMYVPVNHDEEQSKLYLGAILERCLCGETHDDSNPNCDGTKIQWMAWTSKTSLPSSGNWYLTDHVTVYGQTGVNNATVNLSLNGYSISVGAENCRVYQAQNGAVINITNWNKLDGGVIRNAYDYLNNNGGIFLIHNIAGESPNAPVVTLTGITVTAKGCSVGGGDGGAVFVGGGCSLSAYKSTITGSDEANHGNAIHISGDVTLTDCDVVGGTAEQGGAIYNGGTLTMTGCIITGTSGKAAYDCIASGGTLIMTDCTINGTGEAVVVWGNTTMTNVTVNTEIGLMGTAAFNNVTATKKIHCNGNLTVNGGSYSEISLNGGQTLNVDGKVNISNLYLNGGTLNISSSIDAQSTIALTTGGNTREMTLISGVPSNYKNIFSESASDWQITWENPDASDKGDVCLRPSTVMVHCICGQDHSDPAAVTGSCNGGQIAWYQWTETTSLPTSGYWYLANGVTTGDVTLTAGELALDLNGQTITLASDKTRVFYVDGGSLILTDATSNPGTVKTGEVNRDVRGLILDVVKGSAQVYNVILDARGATNVGEGTAVNLYGAGKSDVKLYNTTVYGGTTNLHGAAIAVTNGEDVLHLDACTVYGGTAVNGGAIQIGNNAGVTIKNSTIYGSDVSGNGGAIRYYPIGYWGVLTIEDSTIIGGNAPLGGAVYIMNGTVNMTDVTIGGEDKGGIAKEGGNLYVASGTVTIEGGSITHGTAVGTAVANDKDWGYGGNICVKGGTVTLNGVTVSDGVSGDKNNNHNTNGSTNTGRGGNIRLDGGSLTITDSVISGGIANKQGGNISVNAGTLNLVTSVISGGASRDTGGNLHVAGGNVTVEGSTVSGNSGKGESIFATAGTIKILSKGETAADIDDIRINNSSVVTSLMGIVEIDKLDVASGATVNTRYLTYVSSHIGVTAYGGTFATEFQGNQDEARACFTSKLDGEIYLLGTDVALGKFHCECGAAESGTCTVCGTDATLWLPRTGLTTSEGYWYLINDVGVNNDHNAQYSCDGKNVYIDLNGHTVKNINNGKLQRLTRMRNTVGTLVITDSSADHAGKLVSVYDSALSGSVGDQGLILWANCGNIRVYNITMDAEKSSSNSDGIAICQEGTANVKLQNVTIIGGTTTGNGGAIKKAGSGNLEIIDCTITGGSAGNLGDTIHITGTGKVTITDSSISGEAVFNGDNENVLTNVTAKGTLDLMGGKITANNLILDETTIKVGAIDAESSIAVSGENGTLVVADVEESVADYFSAYYSDSQQITWEGKDTGNIYLRAKNVIVNCICGQDHSDPAAVTGDCDGTQVAWYPVESLGQVADSGYYYLTKSATIDWQWVVDYDVNLSLNGNDITFVGTTSNGDNRLLHACGNAQWNITNWTNSTGGQLINNVGYIANTDVGIVLFLRETACANLYNVTLDARNATGVNEGGALYVGGGSTVGLYNCTVYGSATNSEGGAIWSTGNLKMVGCTVIGSGLNIYHDAITSKGTLEMIDCTVSGSGEAVFLVGTATLTNSTINSQIALGGCTLTMNNAVVADTVHINGDSTVTVNGGTYSVLSLNSGSLALNGKVTDTKVLVNDADLTIGSDFSAESSVVLQYNLGSEMTLMTGVASDMANAFSIVNSDSWQITWENPDGGETGNVCVRASNVIISCICGHAHTTEDPAVGTCNGAQVAWYPTDTLTGLTSGAYYYLTDSVQCDDQWGGDIRLNLSLNGNNITFAAEGSSRLLQPNSGTTWNITNWDNTEGGQLINAVGYQNLDTTVETDGEIGGVLFLNGATANLYNVDLVATGAQNMGQGGALFVNGSSTANLYGCTITGCDVIVNGGAIYSAGTLNMVDCTVSGSVEIAGGTVNMNGGTYNNSVNVNGGTVNMTGTMSFSTSNGMTIGAATVNMNDGLIATGYIGITNANAKVTLNGTVNVNYINVAGSAGTAAGPIVVGETFSQNSVVKVNRANAYMNYPIVTGLNTDWSNVFVSTDGNKKVISVKESDGTISLYLANVTETLPTTAGYYALKNDVSLTSAWTPAGKVVLDLNGNTITAAEGSTGIGLITLSSGDDVYLVGAGSVTAVSGSTARMIYIASNSRLTLDGPTIDGRNVNTTVSGAVLQCDSANARFVMENGTIYGGKSSGVGGVAFVCWGGSFTVNNGTVFGGTTTNGSGGGAIYISGGSIYVGKNAILDGGNAPVGGVLSVNRAGRTGDSNGASVTVTIDGTVKGGHATSEGGNIWMNNKDRSNVTINGSVINGTAVTGGNVLAKEGTSVTISDGANVSGGTATNGANLYLNVGVIYNGATLTAVFAE